MKLTKEDYVAKIASADRAHLVVINYELLISYLKDSIESFGGEGYGGLLKKAQSALGLLMDSLDMKYDISKDLMRIYIYVNKLIIEAQFAKDTKGLQDAAEIMTTLLSSWETVAEAEGKNASVMDGSQRIVAGLTYKNGGLDEIVIDDGNGGYRA